MTCKTRMVIIDDLEPIEAETIVQFLKDAIENGDLTLAIQDCMTIADEIKFHQFQKGIRASWICSYKHNGQRCGKTESDTIHRLQTYEMQ